MAAMQARAQQDSRLRRFGETARRAYVEFLHLPILVIAAFLLLAAVTSALDFAASGWLETARAAMREHMFRDSEATSNLLATIAGGIITVTSITFSLLLLAVQQAASALTHQVYDQFMRRRVNQVYFGFFVGLAVYTLVILGTVNPPYNPVFGATAALLLTLAALVLMILLLYTTLNQMRPVVVIETIHDHVLTAWDRHRELVRRTRREAQGSAGTVTPVQADAHGYVVYVDLDALARAAGAARGEIEIVLPMAIGHYVAFQDVLALVRTTDAQDAPALAQAVRAAVRLEQQRDLDADPAYGIDQLETIAWTSVSTAKSNPSPGIMVLHSLRDLLARWCAQAARGDAEATAPERVPVVYQDNVIVKLLDAFETLAVVASESMQPQTMASVMRCFAQMFARLPVAQQAHAEDLIRRCLSALGEHVLTAELESALSDVACALDEKGRLGTAREVRSARDALGASIGKLGSRATRMAAAGA